MFNCVTRPLIRDVLLCTSIEIILSYLERITWSKCFLVCQKYQASGVHRLLVAVDVPINTQEGQPMTPEPSRPSSPAVKGSGLQEYLSLCAKEPILLALSETCACRVQNQFNLGQVCRGKAPSCYHSLWIKREVFTLSQRNKHLWRVWGWSHVQCLVQGNLVAWLFK